MLICCVDLTQQLYCHKQAWLWSLQQQDCWTNDEVSLKDERYMTLLQENRQSLGRSLHTAYRVGVDIDTPVRRVYVCFAEKWE